MPYFFRCGHLRELRYRHYFSCPIRARNVGFPCSTPPAHQVVLVPSGLWITSTTRGETVVCVLPKPAAEHYFPSLNRTRFDVEPQALIRSVLARLNAFPCPVSAFCIGSGVSITSNGASSLIAYEHDLDSHSFLSPDFSFLAIDF